MQQHNVTQDSVMQTRAIAWAFLILAIMLEVGGVGMLKAIPLWLAPFGDENGVLLLGGMEIAITMIAKAVLLCMIAASYYCMSLALRKIALGVAYSVWEIVGMIGILLITFLFFDPVLTTKEYIGIAVGSLGILCVILGEEH